MFQYSRQLVIPKQQTMQVWQKYVIKMWPRTCDVVYLGLVHGDLGNLLNVVMSPAYLAVAEETCGQPPHLYNGTVQL